MLSSATELKSPQAFHGLLLLSMPHTFKKRGGRKEIIHPDQPEPQSPLVTQIVRAFKWQKMLDEGKYKTVRELANALGLNESYVATTIRYTAGSGYCGSNLEWK